MKHLSSCTKLKDFCCPGTCRQAILSDTVKRRHPSRWNHRGFFRIRKEHFGGHLRRKHAGGEKAGGTRTGVLAVAQGTLCVTQGCWECRWFGVADQPVITIRNTFGLFFFFFFFCHLCFFLCYMTVFCVKRWKPSFLSSLTVTFIVKASGLCIFVPCRVFWHMIGAY